MTTLQSLGTGRPQALRAEWTALLETCRQMPGLSIPPVPLRVLSQARRIPRTDKFTDKVRAQHAAQAALSPLSEHILAHGSGHLIPIEEPRRGGRQTDSMGGLIRIRA